MMVSEPLPEVDGIDELLLAKLVEGATLTLLSSDVSDPISLARSLRTS